MVDDLLADGYFNITVLDISQSALELAKARLGKASESIHWLHADVTEHFPAGSYDVWHDRAVFHFLTKPEDRAAYIRNVSRAVKPGGHVIVSTFGPEGPEKCSGLTVRRYDTDALHQEFGARSGLLKAQRKFTTRLSEARSNFSIVIAWWSNTPGFCA